MDKYEKTRGLNLNENQIVLVETSIIKPYANISEAIKKMNVSGDKNRYALFGPVIKEGPLYRLGPSNLATLAESLKTILQETEMPVDLVYKSFMVNQFKHPENPTERIFEFGVNLPEITTFAQDHLESRGIMWENILVYGIPQPLISKKQNE